MDSGAKKERPENRREHANPVSAATFMYTLPTFFKGFKADLEMSDLPKPLSEHESSMLGDKLETTWSSEVEKAKKSQRDPSLLRVIVRVFWAEYMFYGLVYAFAEFAIRLMQPICLGKLIRFFTPVESRSNVTYGLTRSDLQEDFGNNSTKVVQPVALGYLISFYTSNQDITLEEAYFYAGAVVACSLLNVFFVHPYMMGCLHIGMKMRVSCCSLIYRKSLKLSKTAIGQTTVGQLVNLLSNDVNRFDVAMIFGHNLWVGPLETIVITYLMYLQVGISAVIGVCFLLIFIPLQIFLGKKTSVLRLRTAIRTDERVRLMSEIISGIQVIKMYTWEKPFNALVALARRYEIKTIRGTSYIRGIILSFIMFTTRISIFVSVLSYVLLGNRITAEQVFVLTSFYGILRQNMTVFFPNGIGQLAEAIVSIRRLNMFMLYNENTATLADEKNDEVILNGSSKGPAMDTDEKGIFMKEVTAKWTTNGAENTLDGITLQVRPAHLVAVIGPVGSGKSSLLHAILKELPLTAGSIDVNGTVSYASQEPWLFAGSVRQNILFGLPMDKVRYRVVIKKCALERDFQLFPYGDKTIVGERGVSLSGGQRARINLARAVYKQADVYLLDDPLSAVDTHVGKQLFEQCITGYLKSKTVILITHQLQYLKDVDQIVILKNGKIEAQGDYNTLRASGLDFAKMLDEQRADIEDEPQGPTTGVSRHSSIHSVVSESQDEPKQVEEHKSEGTIGSYVYSQYFKNSGNACFVFVVFALFILAQGAGSGGDYFITYWVNLEQVNYDLANGISNDTLGGVWDLDRNTCIYIYSGVTAATIIITLVRSFTFFTMCMRASVKLHDRMFTSITRAPMYFFNTNPSGRILNRFSKDMGAIDELLPQVLIDCLQIGLTLLGIIIVVAVVNPYLLIPTILVGVIFYMLRIFYLRTGRSVKRLEGVTRSPVFSHLNASLQGLTTIRAFKAQAVLEKEFDAHQDLHSSAWFLFLSTSRAFGFWLDLICVIYIAVVTLSFLVLGDDFMGGNVGLAITQSIGLTGMFQWGMRQSTELENQMTSVERVLEYSDLESEKSLETKDIRVPADWPSEGRVKFINVFLRYSPNEPHVLRNLNFTIEPEEKVGIVGRTGAGKSSLIAALFQLTETEGVIEIDRIDISDLGLHDLRSKVSIIPQEPVLFSGTMRKNLDPFDEYSDDVLWRALDDVELKEAVDDLASGLNSKMSEGGSNFSVGQRQLVCLARAIIRNNRILVLDEATANVDPHTDGLIQTTIRKKFLKCTVLTIAHRLHTIMDSDKVLVMDAGTMVEFDHPHILLQLKNGFLYGMVQQTGPAMAETLAQIAELHFRKTVLLENMIPEENQ